MFQRKPVAQSRTQCTAVAKPWAMFTIGCTKKSCWPRLQLLVGSWTMLAFQHAICNLNRSVMAHWLLEPDAFWQTFWAAMFPRLEHQIHSMQNTLAWERVWHKTVISVMYWYKFRFRWSPGWYRFGCWQIPQLWSWLLGLANNVHWHFASVQWSRHLCSILWLSNVERWCLFIFFLWKVQAVWIFCSW